jgi:hypothetical protein
MTITWSTCPPGTPSPWLGTSPASSRCRSASTSSPANDRSSSRVAGQLQPPGVLRVLRSKACRTAVMFNDALSHQQGLQAPAAAVAAA